MARNTGCGLGDYLDPQFIDGENDIFGVIDNGDGSDVWDIGGIVDVMLVDGRVAMVNQEGIIVGYR